MSWKKINALHAIDCLVWMLIVYWICSLLFFYGCRSQKTTREETFIEKSVFRDTVVSIPVAFDTFTVSTQLRDTVIFSSRPYSKAKLEIETKDEFAKIIYHSDTVFIRLDSAIQKNEKSKVIHDVRTVYKCDNKFHFFSEWLSIIFILIVLIYVTIRAFIGK